MAENNKTNTSFGKPKITDNNKVLLGVIRSPSCVVNLRLLNKMHCRTMCIDNVIGNKFNNMYLFYLNINIFGCIFKT